MGKESTDLFGKQTMHDKEHKSLKTAKNGEKVRHWFGAFLKLETSEYPHDAQDTQLSHCSNSECPVGGSTDTGTVKLMYNSNRISE